MKRSALCKAQKLRNLVKSLYLEHEVDYFEANFERGEKWKKYTYVDNSDLFCELLLGVQVNIFTKFVKKKKMKTSLDTN